MELLSIKMAHGLATTFHNDQLTCAETKTGKQDAALPKVCQIDHAHQTWTLDLDIKPEHLLLEFNQRH